MYGTGRSQEVGNGGQVCGDVEAVCFPVQNIYKMTYSDDNATFEPVNGYGFRAGELLSPVIKTEFVHVLSPQDGPKVLPLLIPSRDHSAGSVLVHRLNEMCPSEQ